MTPGSTIVSIVEVFFHSPVASKEIYLIQLSIVRENEFDFRPRIQTQIE